VRSGQAFDNGRAAPERRLSEEDEPVLESTFPVVSILQCLAEVEISMASKFTL
jgi:hypothetical protein